MEIFRLKDYQNKNILIIGNKPIKQLSKEQIDFINSFDIIIRINGMNNLNETGHRVDWWWLNIWNWNVLKANIGNKNYTSAKVIFVDAHSEHFSTPQQLFTHLPNLNKNILKFNTKWSSIDLHTQCHLWKPNASDCTIPTSDVICISYIITKFPNTKIYLTCLDIEKRDKLFKSHSNWQHTWHANVGELESEYLQKLMLTNKIEFINFENK